MNIVVSNLLTHYRRAGRGKLVVCIPGWADTSLSWQRLQQDLSGHYDVVVLDVPGFGGTQLPDQTWGLRDFAAFAGQFVEKLGAGQPFALLGHSNGGAIAITALSQGDVHCDKLVLLASAGIRGQAEQRRRLLQLVTKTGKVLSTPLPDRIKRRLRRWVYQAAGSDMLLAEHMQGTFKRVVASDVRPDAARVAVPTLLLYGARDTATPPSYGQTFQGLIEDARLHIVPDAGHFLLQDAPAMVAKSVTEFLAS